MITLQPGFLKYHQDKTTAKDGPRIGASPTGRVKKSVVHAPTEPRAIHAMPIVPIIAAIGSAVAGYGVVTAGIGALAAGSVGAMIVGGAMMVGAALTVVGVVTGNEKLMKVGGILSLAGGIGAGVAGLMGAASGAASGAAGAIPMAEMAGPTATGLEAAVPMADMAGATGSAATAATNTGSGGIMNLAGPGELASAGDVATQGANAAQNTAQMAVGDTAPQVVDPLGTKTSFATPMGEGSNAYATNGQQILKPQEGSGILNWMDKNKQATEMIGGAVKGAVGMIPTDQSKANTALTKEQISALQLQQERDKRRLAYAQGKLYKGG